VPRTENQQADGLVNSVLDAHIAALGEDV